MTPIPIAEPGRTQIAADQIDYVDLYKRWEAGNWSAMDLDFTQDKIDWDDKFDDFMRKAARWNYSLFFFGEDEVADQLSPFVDAAPLEEQKYFLTTQQVDEARHAIFFSRFFGEVIGVGGDSYSDRLKAADGDLTYGIKKAKMKAVIPGQHASIRTLDAQPGFYFYFEDKAAGLGKSGFGSGAVSNPNQFALINLDVTKSSRETIIGEFGALGATTGTHEKSMVTFKSERIRAGLYKVVPNGPMTPGEYCFLVSQVSMGAFGAGAAGAAQIFDFAVNLNQ